MKEQRDYLVSQEQELRRSEFLITNGGYVGAKASLLSTTPPFAIMKRKKIPNQILGESKKERKFLTKDRKKTKQNI